MAKIKVLPETVQNKIAAGEVIERPASVVKELAENAMDAGARMVAVELEEGGHRLIRVSDDGSGMDEADLVASLQRHATSKISDVDDIFRIATFGFRGEALPSIGSVSRLRIATCRKGEAEGREIEVEGGKIVRLSPAAPRQGTVVEVRDIFYNTPARRKFLKQPGSENTRASEIITRLALGNPGIGFRLQTGDRLTLSVKPAATQLERITEIFGKETAAKLVPFTRDIADGLSVSGFFAKPPKSCRNTKDIYVLVNRRWIRYYALARAVGDAFQGALPPREYPFAIINLEVDPARVDLNVHPAKEEVRFEREDILISGVRRAIRDALGEVAALPTAVNLASPPPAPDPATWRPSSIAPVRSFDAAAPDSGFRAARSGFSRLDLDATREIMRGGDWPTVAPAASESEAPAPPTPESPRFGGGGLLGGSGQYRILGQAGGRYIIVDGPEGILLVDPHALHERWNFDRLVAAKQAGGLGERLLLPIELRLSPAESAAAADAAPDLAAYGFACEIIDINTLRVTSAPDFIPPAKLENLLRQILADVGEAPTALAAAQDRLLASLACRASVLLGRNLPEEEMLALLDRFFNQGQMPTCPHGRPTAIRIDWNELARRFGR